MQVSSLNLDSNFVAKLLAICVPSAITYYVANKKLDQIHKQEQTCTSLLNKLNQEKEQLSNLLRKNESMQNIKQQDISDQQQDENQSNKIYRICITGGPCAGKTSSLVQISEKLRDEGFNVFTVPEASTIIANAGGMIQMQNYTDEQSMKFQTALMRSQVQLEDTFIGIAKLSKQKAIVLCDRGLMDGSAYIRQDLWNKMLQHWEIDEVQIRDRRYDCVIHLVTAADGAESYYNKNNEARHESPQEAIQVDRKLQLAWLGHPNCKLVDNYSVKTFEEKIQKTLTIVRQIVGLNPEVKIFHKKFLLDTHELQISYPENIKVVKVFIEDNFIQHQLYLEGPEHKIYTKVRQRGNQNQYIYLWSQSEFKNGVLIGKKKRILTFKEYLFYFQFKDANRQHIFKIRECFMYEGLSYMIDSFLNIKEGFSMLKVKMENENQNYIIPQFLKIKREVTNEIGYKSRFLAKKNWYIPKGDEDVINIRKDSF